MWGRFFVGSGAADDPRVDAAVSLHWQLIDFGRPSDDQFSGLTRYEFDDDV